MTTTAFDVISPVDETIVQTVRFADRAEMDARVERADRAFATWRRVAPGDRARLLRRFADAVDADIETLAGLEVRNAGHTIGNARWEAGNVRDVLGYYAAAPERLAGRQIPVAGGSTSPSTSRWGWSASSCRGTSRCRWPPGDSPRPSPRAT